jgi:hypothetical protein
VITRQDRRGSLTTHWGLALAAAFLCGYIGVAAFVNGGSDRPGGVILSIVAACAVLALLRVRTAPPAAVARTILGIVVLQIVATIVLVAAHWGAPFVISAVNGILIVAWAVSGVAFYAAARQGGA